MDLVYKVSQLTWLRGNSKFMESQFLLHHLSCKSNCSTCHTEGQWIILSSAVEFCLYPTFVVIFLVKNVQPLVSNTEEWKWYAQVFQQLV